MRTISVGGIGSLAAAAAAMVAIAGPSIDEVPRRGPQPMRPVYRKSGRLNRSRHWPYAETYEEARAMSPSSRPVR